MYIPEVLRHKTASVVVNALKNVFIQLGVSKIVRSDNGPCYNSKEFLEFVGAYGLYLITSSPRYPELNGLAESGNDQQTNHCVDCLQNDTIGHRLFA